MRTTSPCYTVPCTSGWGRGGGWAGMPPGTNQQTSFEADGRCYTPTPIDLLALLVSHVSLARFTCSATALTVHAELSLAAACASRAFPLLPFPPPAWVCYPFHSCRVSLCLSNVLAVLMKAEQCCTLLQDPGVFRYFPLLHPAWPLALLHYP